MKKLLLLSALAILGLHQTIEAQCSFTTNIAASGPTLACGNVTLSAAVTGNTWTQRANYGSSARRYATGFSIGTKGYIGLGNGSPTYLGDFWEYDPSNNSWSQKANFGGTARYAAVGFSIGNKGYVGTGFNGSYLNDFWEYDPSTNFWTQKASFSGTVRAYAVGFGLNSKGYIGTGYNGSYLSDFWEYDPNTNFWTQKASFGGGSRYLSVGMAVSSFSLGYIGSGYNGSAGTNDLWEYNPSTNFWTQRASFGTATIYGAIGFATFNKAFITTGYESNTSVISDKIWEFNPSNNSWTQKTSIGAANGRYYGTGFAIGLKGFVGTGLNSSNLNTFWEYESAGTYSWSNGANTQAITATVSGNYSVLITNGAGCTATAVQALSLSPNPTITVSGASLSCAGISNTILASGASSYTWSANAGSSNSNSVILTPTASTSYTVTGSTGSCIVNYPIVLNVNPVPIASISVSGPTLGCGTLTLSTNAGGNTWTQKAGLNVGRQYGVAFSIGNKGYIGTGYNGSYYNDFWEYDPTTNSWTQKANFGGSARYMAVGFPIGTKGYIGTGYNGSVLNDFWEYDPSINSWTQKANVGGVARYAAVGFNIGTKGYLGTGYGGNYRNDFWEYDPSTNTWTQKTNFAGTARYGAMGFAIGTKCYLGTGYTNAGITNDFWEYDPSNNSWTSKANYTGGAGGELAAFSIGTKGYAGTGNMSNVYENSFYEYDPSNNLWTLKSNFGGVARATASAFSIGGKGYMGIGYANTSPYYMNDIWEYTPSNAIIWSNASTLQAIAVSNSGNYSVTISNQYGCSASAAQIVSLSPNPNISVTGASIACAGISNTLVASGAGSYTWSANAGGGNSNFVVVSPTISTVYTLSGTTGTCTVIYPINLVVNPLPISTIAVSGPTLGCGTVTLSTAGNGNFWTQKAGLNIGRQNGVAFSIGNKGYIGTGYNGNNSPYTFGDFWEYDPNTNAWTQKANFGGVARSYAIGFSIGSKGYIGTGLDNSSTYKNDFWEYDPSANTWTQKANFGGTARYYAVGFAIGSKGYIGTGYDNNYKNDFWEYDPSNNTWVQKASLIGSARYGATGFGLANKGYIGTGSGNASPYSYSDFWEYDPSNNTWTQKANYTPGARFSATGFGLNNKGFIGTGQNTSSAYTNDFWEFDPNNNTWIQRANFGGSARFSSGSFALNGKGYLGIGYSNSSPNYMNDVWQYDPISTVLWSTSSTLQAISVSNTGNYSVTVTNQSGCSSSSSQFLALSPNPTISVTGNSVLCAGSSNTYIANGANSYTWSANAGGSNSNSVVLNPTSTVVYTVSGTTGTCTVNFPVSVNVNPVPNASISVSGPTLGCGTITLSTAAGGNTWTQKAGLNVGRQYGVAFSIGNKGYMGTGYTGSYFVDFWEYDQATNAWTQKANFGGSARYMATGFSIGSKGYIGTGYDGSARNDFWEYDPSTNIWTQKANFSGVARYGAVGFGIGTKGYIGTGYGGGYQNDLWEYDPSINSWTQKSNFPGSARYLSFGLAIGTKGYIGTGIAGSAYSDFYEYDPSSNTWASRANYAGGAGYEITAFTLGSKGYAGTGNINSIYSNTFFEYDPSINTWTQKANYSGAPRSTASAFALSGKGYLGIGYSNSSPYYMNDVWEYTPNSTVLWSNASTLQAIPVSVSGSYSVTITNQSGCSASSSQSVALSPNPTITVSGASISCAGQSNTLVANGAGSYTWSGNAGGGNSNSVVVTPFSLSIYTVSGSTGSCSVNVPVTLNANPVPVASIAVSGPTVSCGTLTLSTSAGGDTWTQRAGMNTGRLEAVSFSIGNKGYLGTGSSSSIYFMNDFWEYDPSTNSWSQKANFGGTARWGAVGFNIGNKGYIGTGYDNNYKNDFWEYDPTTNTWTQKANLGGAVRYRATGFTIGSKGYIGTGFSGSYLNDFWEYDPNVNTWTQKTNFGGTVRMQAASFSIGNFGYIGTGNNGNYLSDFWEYNSSSNTWTQKANFGGTARYFATGYSIGNKGFIATGLDAATGSKNDNWEYDPTNNTWNQRTLFSGTARYAASNFVMGGKVYIANGYNSSSGIYLNDLWEYTPLNNILWSTASTASVLPVFSSGNYSVTITSQFGCAATSAQSVSLSPNPTVNVTGNSGISCANTNNTLIATGAGSYTWSANAGGSNSNSVVVSPTSSAIYTVTGASGSCAVNVPVQLDVYPTPIANIITIGSSTVCGSSITLSTNISAGNSWTQKQGLNTGRQYAVSFNIGSKGYLGTGYNGSYLNDFWEYDPFTNSWTQKANFGGLARYLAVGFSVGSKGYIGSGYSGTYRNDFWEYDPSINTWTQKANFGGTARYGAAAFSIANKAYVGTGYSGSYLNDFWEYNPSTDTWTQKASFSGTSRFGAFGFSAIGKGFIGTGTSGTNQLDMWQYDPTTNFWTQRANLGTSGRAGASVFVLSDRAFVAGGNTLADFWEYNATNNTWTQRTNFNTTYKNYMTGFSINGKGYMGTGSGPSSYYNDIWEYTPPVTYSWSTGSTLTAITTSVSGNYSLTVNNIYGCSSTTFQPVSITPAPTISISGPTMVCQGSSLNLSVTGASNYTWSANAGSALTNTISVNPTSSVTYSVIASSGACTSTASRPILVNALPIISANASALNVCSGNTLNLFGGGAATYTWSNGVNNNFPFTPTLTTTYSLSGTDFNMCTNTAVVTVTVNNIPVITVNSGTICQGQNFTITPGGASSYVYSSGSAIVSPNTTSTYSVTGTSSAGCVSAAAAISTVIVSSAPTVAVSGGTICSGQSFTLSPTGAVSYVYSSGSPIVSPTINTTYSVVGTGSNGCASAIPALATVIVNTSPNVVAASGSICAGGSFTINPSGASNYTYSSGSNVVSPVLTSTYSVIGSNGSGCVNSNPVIVTVTVNALPNISVNSGTICQGQSFTITPNGASTYTYSSGSSVVSPIANNNYSVTGTSAFGCVSSTVAVSSVNVLASPTVAVTGGSICAGQSFTLLPTGAVSYVYSGGSQVVSPISNTTYSVVGTGSNGCTSALPAIATITVNSVPNVSAPSGSICSGSSFTINPTGALSYTYSSGSNIVTPNINTSYTVTGSSSVGCVSSIPAIVTVTVNAIPVVTVNSGTICQGQSFTMVPGGASTYSYSGGSAIVSPTLSSTYSVSGTSTAGCVSGAVAVSSINVLFSPTVAVTGGTICSGQSFTLSPTGAASYIYSGGSAVVSPTNNTTYTVVGTGTNGCNNANAAVATVTVRALPIIAAVSGSICSGSSFTINPTATGGGAVSYTYSGGSQIVSPVANTNYSVSGTSSLGCVSASPAVITVTVNAIPVITVNSGTICQGQSFTMVPSGASTYSYSGGSAIVSPTLNSTYSVSGTSTAGCVSGAVAVSSINVLFSPTVSVMGGTICSGQSFTLSPVGATSYVFSGGSAIVSPTVNTTYTVVGTSTNGCNNALPAVATVTVRALPIITAASGSICNGSSFTINPSGALSYTYSSGSNIVSPNSTSSYSVSGTSTAGCVNSIPTIVTVTVNTIPVISVNSGTICNGLSFTLNPIGANTYTYSGGSAIVTPSILSNYSVVGTSAFGCVSSAPAIATVSVLSSPIVSVTGGTICSGQSFTLSPTGAVSYVYSGGNAVVSPTTNSTYTVVGTGTNGCNNATPAIATITVKALPIVSAPSGSICIGNSFTISPNSTGGGAVSYTYSGGSQIVSPLTNTSYSISATSSAGCISAIPAVVNVTVNTIPTISVNSGTVCSGQSFTINASGAQSYTYSGGNSVVVPTSNTTYSVSGTSSAGCSSTVFAVSNVTVFALPIVSANGGTICSGQSFSITPNGAASYTYSSGSSIVNPSITTSYSVTGTSSLGCVTATAALVAVTVNTLPVISANSGSICNGKSFTIVPSGANSYTFSSGSNVISPNTTSSYSITGSNANGCQSASATIIQVSVVANPTITLPSVAFICFGNTYTIVPSGALSYTYSSGTNVVNPNTTSNYTVSGSSAQGCIGNAVITVSVQPSLTVTITGPSVTCEGNNITLIGNGANSYTWSNGVTSNSISITPTATSAYSVSAGSGNCAGNASVSVLVNSNPTISLASSNSIICANEPITISAFGANTYTWDNGVSGSSIVVTPSVNTTYSVTGIDANGCINVASISQSVEACLGNLELKTKLNNSIQVYPNPSRGQVYINFESMINNASIEIYNYIGQLVVKENAYGLNTQIDFKNTANGLYTIRVVADNKVLFITKLIKE